MSYTEIYGVKNNGEVVFVGEVENAWRGAMFVWKQLADKYEVGGDLFGGFHELWAMADTGRLVDYENMVMKSTFDNVVVKREDLARLIMSFRKYGELNPNSSFLEQAKIIEEEILKDGNMVGVCWNQISVNENPWCNGFDEEADEYIPYNTTKQNKHWYM